MNYAFNFMVNSLYEEINVLINKSIVSFERDHINILSLTNNHILYYENLIQNYKHSDEVFNKLFVIVFPLLMNLLID